MTIMPDTPNQTNQPSCIAVFTTTDTQEAAWNIADTLLAQNLIACAQVQAVESRYLWDAVVQSRTEYKLLLKTTEAQYHTIERIVLTMHPYELPAVYALPLAAIEPHFAAWVAEQSSGSTA